MHSATYGAELRWTRFLEGTHVWRVSGYPTPEAAWTSVLDSASVAGWTPPRWWEFWRRHDTRPPAWMRPLAAARATATNEERRRQEEEQS
jgi:hypothetical protein